MRRLVDDPPPAKFSSPLIDMADQHPPQTGKRLKGFFNRLKKVFVATPTVSAEEAAKLRARYTHFRILVIGRANAGKTTVLKRVCNTKEDPIYSEVRYLLRLLPRPLSSSFH